MIKLTVNGISHNVDADPDTPLLWVHPRVARHDRHEIRLRHRAVRRLHRASRRRRDAIVPGAGRARWARRRSPPSRACRRTGSAIRCRSPGSQHDVPQCGYCQSGQIMAAAALLKTNPKPSDDDIDAAITNICRCGTYQRIREAIHTAASTRRQGIGRRHHEQPTCTPSPFLPRHDCRPGGGLALGWHVPAALLAQARRTASSASGWSSVRMTRPSCASPVPRWGRARFTGLAQLVADELDCDWKHVRAEYVSPDENLAHKRAWGDMSTGGSRGIRGSVDYVRKGGAAARAMLIAAAAQRWSVPAAECTAANSVVTHTPSGRTLRYGEVAADAAKLPVPTEVKLKTPAQWTIIGKGVRRLDTVDKLSGKQVFAIDVQLPDMLNAAIAQCPVFGGKLKSFDADKIKSMPGVRHVVAVGDNAVAVVADKWYQAKTALAALPIVWDEGAERHCRQRADRRPAEGRARREGGGARPEARRRRGGACRRGKGGRGGVRRAVPGPRHDGADELHGEVRRRQGGDLGAVAERRRVARRGGRGRGREAGRREGEQAASRRRLRPARPAGLHAPGRADRQAGAGHAR